MEKKNVLVFVVFRFENRDFPFYPAYHVHEFSLSYLMDRRLYIDEEVTLTEYVGNERTRIVDVFNGEYHERP